MGRQQNLGCALVALIVLQMALPALALPQLLGKVAEQGKIKRFENIESFPVSNNVVACQSIGRKFAVKPNSNKKVITESNEIAVLGIIN